MKLNSFAAAMTESEFLDGEMHYARYQKSRKLAMLAGLTKSSEELAQCWKSNPMLYEVALNGAIAAYERSKVLEDLLINCIARLTSVVEAGSGDTIDSAMEILRTNSSAH